MKKKAARGFAGTRARVRVCVVGVCARARRVCVRVRVKRVVARQGVVLALRNLARELAQNLPLAAFAADDANPKPSDRKRSHIIRGDSSTLRMIEDFLPRKKGAPFSKSAYAGSVERERKGADDDSLSGRKGRDLLTTARTEGTLTATDGS